MRSAVLCAIAALSAACIDEIDARWQLDHDHVIAARATPPRIRSGEATGLDALVAYKGRPVAVEDPTDVALANAPAEIARYLVRDGSRWQLHAPDADTLKSVRPALGLPEDAPVPVDVLLTFPNLGTRRATALPFKVKKTVWLGEPSTNPALPPITIDGVPAGDEIVVPIGRDIYVSADAPPGLRVNWLTNVGALFQDDVATAFVRVLPEDRKDGQLVAVVRDNEGGVAWRVWPMRAE
jgi:hypothetical protein